jgi:acyl-CoA oxidase
MKIRIARLVEADPVLGGHHDVYALSKLQRYVRASERHARADMLLATTHAHFSSSEKAMFLQLAVGPDGSPTSIHQVMFIPTIRAQTSDEQRKLWLPAAESGAIIGCYAQTEMGHGSNVAGLETTATFIPETGEFEIHSPTLTSTKWWPAALGRTATHAVVHCRLRLPAHPASSSSSTTSTSSEMVDHGPKPFLIQLRDLITHINLPGVESARCDCFR